MQKHVHLVDLVKSFPTNIYLQNLASIQKRTSPLKFDHLAEKSGKGSISNLSTKVGQAWRRATTTCTGAPSSGGRRGARRSAGATPPAADAAALVAASLGAPRSDAAPSTYVISRKWWPTAARSRRAVLAGPCSAGLS